MSRAEEVDAELDALNAQVPEIRCRGLCTDACGPIDGGPREMVRMHRAGVALPPRQRAVLTLLREGHYTCPALQDGQCSVYDVRPMICRVWGASEDLVCPYGCRPEPGRRRLTSAETLALLDAARTAGTPEQPKTAEEYERILADPRARATHRRFVHQPTATQPMPPRHRRRSQPE